MCITYEKYNDFIQILVNLDGIFFFKYLIIFSLSHCSKFDLVPPPPGWSQHEMEAPFAVPPHLQGDAAQIENSYSDGLNMFSFSPVTAPQPQIDLQAVTDYVSS